MRIITAAEHRRVPWRNGGGTTREILVEPPGAARFLHRVSLADVDSSGPFSRFEGYERHIVVVHGAGMRLHGVRVGTLQLEPLEPRTFSGDWDVEGSLVDGPVRDFNLIVDRARATSSLEVLRTRLPVTLTLQPDEVSIVHLLEGECATLRRGDTLVTEVATEIVPGSDVILLVGRVRPH